MIRLAFVLLLAPGGQEWRERLAAEEYGGAWEAALALEDPLQRARACAEIRYRAGDPAGALAAAEGGLVHDPHALELLFYASGSALWLAEPERAASHAERLAGALAAAQLTTEARAAWEQTAADHVQRAQSLAFEEAARNRAVSVARAVACVGLGAVLVALLAVARLQGRSSRPVS